MDEIKLTLEEIETMCDDYCTLCDCESCDVHDFCSAYSGMIFHPPN